MTLSIVSSTASSSTTFVLGAITIARRLFPQRQLRGFTRRHGTNRDRAILPDDIVRQLNRTFNHLRRGIVQLNIDLTRRIEHAKAASRSVEEVDKRLRQNVLARVLLQVVQPSRPVDAPAHNITTTRRRTLDHVQHTLVAIVDALDHAHAVERTRVTRLATASRIKRSAIENEGGPATDTISDIDDASVKLDQMRIGIIETFGYSHLSSKIVRPCTLVHAN